MEKTISDLEKYFKHNNQRLIHKWNHYFNIYEHHFNRFRGKEVVILEIGVSHGGSLQMWKNYFGDKAKVYGIDVNPVCKKFEEQNIEVFIGSQSDRRFLRRIKEQIPKLDILIDDGGHMMKQQIISYEELFDHIKDDGVYLCEDLHTSYWLKSGGGFKRRGTFIEFSKKLIDKLHAHHSQQRGLRVTSFTNSVNSLHFYDSILVIEKGKREAPTREKTGQPSFPVSNKLTIREKINIKLSNFFIGGLNKLLRFFNLPGFIWR